VRLQGQKAIFKPKMKRKERAWWRIEKNREWRRRIEQESKNLSF